MDRVQHGKLTTLLNNNVCKCSNPNYLLWSNILKLSLLKPITDFLKETSPTVELQRGIVYPLNNSEWWTNPNQFLPLVT